MDKNASNNKTIKNRNRLENILSTCLLIFSIILLLISGTLLFQKKYYSTFFVSGQSMYPTLNKDIEDADGNKFLNVANESKMDGAKNVDYGIYDHHESALKSIKRFDIVVWNEPTNDSLIEKYLIKRVVALPGETFRFIITGEYKGDVEVLNASGEYVRFETPVERQYIANSAYSSEPYTLASDEYFLCGDNRGASGDSRESSKGPAKYSELEGKVIALTGKGETYLDSNDELAIRNIKHYFWPRFF